MEGAVGGAHRMCSPLMFFLQAVPMWLLACMQGDMSPPYPAPDSCHSAPVSAHTSPQHPHPALC